MVTAILCWKRLISTSKQQDFWRDWPDALVNLYLVYALRISCRVMATGRVKCRLKETPCFSSRSACGDRKIRPNRLAAPTFFSIAGGRRYPSVGEPRTHLQDEHAGRLPTLSDAPPTFGLLFSHALMLFRLLLLPRRTHPATRSARCIARSDKDQSHPGPEAVRCTPRR